MIHRATLAKRLSAPEASGRLYEALMECLAAAPPDYCCRSSCASACGGRVTLLKPAGGKKLAGGCGP